MTSTYNAFNQSTKGAFIQSAKGARDAGTEVIAVTNKALLSGRLAGTGWTTGGGVPKLGQEYMKDVWRVEGVVPDTSNAAIDTLDLSDYCLLSLWNITANLGADEKTALVDFRADQGGWIIVVCYNDAQISYCNDVLSALSSPMEFVDLAEAMNNPITASFEDLSWSDTFRPDITDARTNQVTGGTAIITGVKSISGGNWSSAAWDLGSKTFAIGFQPHTAMEQSFRNRRFFEYVYEYATTYMFPVPLKVTPDDMAVAITMDAPTVTVDSAIDITSINPTSGPIGTTVAVTGSGFTASTTVKFGGTTADNIVFNSSTDIDCDSPAGIGTVDVSVHEGASSDTLTSAYSYTL